MRSSISVGPISPGVRALRMAKTSGVIASAEGPSPSAGRMKVMCFISEDRDLDMGQARGECVVVGGAVLPVHGVQERPIDRGTPALQDGGKRMRGREAGERDVETAAARNRQPGRQQRPK